MSWSVYTTLAQQLVVCVILSHGNPKHHVSSGDGLMRVVMLVMCLQLIFAFLHTYDCHDVPAQLISRLLLFLLLQM